MLLYPLANLSFTLANRQQSIHPPPEEELAPRIATNISTPRTQYINYGALPMRRPEADLMLSYLKPTDIYLEYGASATTLSIPHLVSKSYSIEHDVQVCKGISAEMIRHSQLPDKLRAFCAPVPPGRAGWASVSQFEEGSYKAFHNYVDFPLQNLTDVTFDKVFINGRARVACALRILPQLHQSSLVFFHDFFLRPAHYASVLTFYDEVARVVAHAHVSGYTDDPMGLLVLRPKKEYLKRHADVSIARVNAIYEAYKEETPSEATSGVHVAFTHMLQRTDEGGYPYYEINRVLARQSTRARILLDLIAIPFVMLTYLVLRDVFRKVFLEALSSGGRGSSRFFGTDFRTVSSWGRSAGGVARGLSLPITRVRETVPEGSNSAGGKAE